MTGAISLGVRVQQDRLNVRVPPLAPLGGHHRECVTKLMDPDTMKGMGAKAETGEQACSDIRLRRLFEAHRLDVLGYCMRRVSRWDAHDAAAEVFAVAWRRIDDVPQGDAALPWLYGVARKVLANMYRSQKRRDRLRRRLVAVTEVEEESSDPPIVRLAEHRWVIDAARQLPESDREVLYLIVWEGMSHREAGEVLGVTEAAVKKRLQRAKRRLEKELDRSPRTGDKVAGGGP